MALERSRANQRPALYRDASGRTLADYPRPSVAVDTAVLAVDHGSLCVVLVRPGLDDDPSAHGRHRLPGTFLHDGERLADAVLRSLRDKAGVTGVDPRQLHVFDDLDRDDRGRVLSVAHVVTVPERELVIDTTVALLAPVGSLPALAYQHDEIVDMAISAIRMEYSTLADPRELLDSPFTLRDLQELHESVAGTPIPRDTFRRSMEGGLVDTGMYRRGVVGKPARLFALGRSS